MHRHKHNVLGGLKVLGQVESYILKAAAVLGSSNKSVRFLVRPEDRYCCLKRTTAAWGYLRESHYIHIGSKVRRANYGHYLHLIPVATFDFAIQNP